MKKTLNLKSKTPRCCYIENIEYARRKRGAMGIQAMEESLKMQLLLPRNKSDTKNGLYPLLIFVVGGGFRTPLVHARLPWMTSLAERGFVVAMPAYRGTETNKFPDMLIDIHSAIRYLRIHANDYGIDPKKIVLMGGSAGAHIALQAAYAPNDFNAPTDNLNIPVDVCGVIDLYGIVDVSKIINWNSDLNSLMQSPPMQLVKCFEKEYLEDALTPTKILPYITKEANLPPTMIAHGNRDTTVDISQSEELYKALCEAGKDVEFYRITNAIHADPVFFEDDMMDLYESFIRRVTSF